jgi:hypothetical protein
MTCNDTTTFCVDLSSHVFWNLKGYEQAKLPQLYYKTRSIQGWGTQGMFHPKITLMTLLWMTIAFAK